MSVTTYNVDAGKDRATIELSGETKVVFSFDPNVIAVEAVSGEVNVSLDEGATAGDDGCDTLSEGQSTRMNPIADKCIYVNGTGTVRVWGGRSGEDCPFSKGGKGGGSGGISETNIIPLATPEVVKIEGYEGNAYRSENNGVYMWKSYDYGDQVSCYIDVSTIVSSDILCSNTAKIKLGAALYSNYYSGLTNTLQMYIGNGAPSENDWVTVVSHLVPESTPYTYIDDINVSDINVSGATDGKIYFRMIHGSETNGYNTNIHVFYMNISDE